MYNFSLVNDGDNLLPSVMIQTCPFEIGDTPLTRLGLDLNGIHHTLSLKEERKNAFGSIKDRVAWYILSRAMAQHGEIKAVIDASSGNYGYALSRIGERLDIAVTVVSSPSISSFNADGIRKAGARLVIAEAAPGESSNAARMRTAGEIAAREGLVFLDQYRSDLNPESHEKWTAPEVFGAEDFDACFVTSSSGGTARGFTDYLAKNPCATKLFLVEPFGSCAFVEEGRDDCAKLTIPGYGSGRQSSFAGFSPAPNLLRIEEPKVLAAFSLMRANGLPEIGLSSVGVVLGAINWLSEQDSAKSVVCVCADGAERYADEFDCRYRSTACPEVFAKAHTDLEPVFASLQPE